MAAVMMVPRPSLLWAALEGRTVCELGSFAATMPLVHWMPRGDGHPVLVLPGFLASDLSTAPLRKTLTYLGYNVKGWGLGRNLGPTKKVHDALNTLLQDVLGDIGEQTVSVIGWSLGGVYARELAQRFPERIRQVITLGSPFGAPYSTTAEPVWRVLSRFHTTDLNREAMAAKLRQPLVVPATAIHSRTDGIVPWRGSLEPHTPLSQNIRVAGSHCGLGHNMAAVWVIANRLAQAEGNWRPFESSKVSRILGVKPWQF